MSTSPDHFPLKDPSESLRLSVDFAALTGAVSAAQVSAQRRSGAADASPELMIEGPATIAGAVVTQRVRGGVHGCTYTLRFQVTGDAGDVFVEALPLTVEDAR